MTDTVLFLGREVDGVAFDLEGTIVDLESYHWAAHEETARSVGIKLDLDDPQTFTERVPHFIGGPNEEIMKEILNLAIEENTWHPTSQETSGEKIKQMRRADRATYRGLRDALDEMPPREGFIEVYKQILELGLPTAIGSLTETQDARIILEKSGLDQLFDSQRIILKEDVTNVKPAPEVYQRTAERMGVNPRRQLVFEDSHHGVSAARDAGSVVYGVPTIDQPSVIIRLREAGAIQVATNWNDVRRELFGPEGRPASTQSRGRR